MLEAPAEARGPDPVIPYPPEKPDERLKWLKRLMDESQAFDRWPAPLSDAVIDPELAADQKVVNHFYNKILDIVTKREKPPGEPTPPPMLANPYDDPVIPPTRLPNEQETKDGTVNMELMKSCFVELPKDKQIELYNWIYVTFSHCRIYSQ
jgi:hypothetical protein